MRILLLSILITGLAHAASVRSTGEPGSRWANPEVKVCWLDQPQMPTFDSAPFQRFTDEERAAVKEVIAAEFTADRTGIRFVGWEPCQKSELESDVVRVFQTTDESPEDSEGSAPYGHGEMVDYEVVYKPDTRPVVFLKIYRSGRTSRGISKLSPLDRLRWVALHEFSHVAGLSHERQSWDEFNRNPDRNCTFQGLSPITEISWTRRRFGAYDPNSILNYCYYYLVRDITGLQRHFPESAPGTGQLASIALEDESLIQFTPTPHGTDVQIRIGLSQGDVNGLRCLYLSDHKTDPRCQPAY